VIAAVRVGAAAARHRRQKRRNRVADAGRVVLGRPPRERHDVRRHERVRVKHLANRFHVRRSAFVVRRAIDVGLDDDTGHDAGAERHDDPRADRRERHAFRNAVCQEVKSRNGNGDVDEGQRISSKYEV
jgi:hypothetical protein